MGTATPSLESYFASETGEVTRVELPERIEKRPLPEVQIVDMRREPRLKREPIFSKVLEEQVLAALAKKEQVMLFLNRRGFSTYLHCSSCGYVVTCKDCRVGLTYHFDKGKLVCHLCEYSESPVKLCPACQKANLHYFGIGTQKVEEEARRLFPGSRIGRMDTDSTSRKDSHEVILGQFKKREIDFLIGTQMIAKGHDFPYVSLIGVISADTALHLPDFRAAERTFDVLTQVAGRAGRGDIPGKVLIHFEMKHGASLVNEVIKDKFKLFEDIFKVTVTMANVENEKKPTVLVTTASR
jgi:primosomal protein N' (replication factor Y)